MVATETVRLHGVWASPAVRRVQWALAMKGVEYEYVEEDLSSKSPTLLACNPVNKEVPVLVHGGRPVVESLVIVEYVDETWRGGRPIMPKDPYERARARFLAAFADGKCREAARDAFFLEGEGQARALEALQEALGVLEEELTARRFFGGERIGFADLALGWTAFWLGVVEEVAGVEVVAREKHPRFASWARWFVEDPAVKENLPPRDKAVAFFRGYRQRKLAESKLQRS